MDQIIMRLLFAALYRQVASLKKKKLKCIILHATSVSVIIYGVKIKPWKSAFQNYGFIALKLRKSAS